MGSEESAYAQSAAVDLGASADRLWRDYLALHDEQRRAEALEVLARFAAAAEVARALSRRRFVERLAVAWLDPELPDPPRYPAALRFPLLQRVVIPELKRGYLDGNADCTRRLAQATRGAPPSRTAGLPSPIDLLREAHEHDPQNMMTARALLLGLIRGLEYVVHEVPSGLLDTPAETLRDIDDAFALAGALGQADELERRLAHWRELAQSYADYLANRPGGTLGLTTSRSTASRRRRNHRRNLRFVTPEDFVKLDGPAKEAVITAVLARNGVEDLHAEGAFDDAQAPTLSRLFRQCVAEVSYAATISDDDGAMDLVLSVADKGHEDAGDDLRMLCLTGAAAQAVALSPSGAPSSTKPARSSRSRLRLASSDKTGPSGSCSRASVCSSFSRSSGNGNRPRFRLSSGRGSSEAKGGPPQHAHSSRKRVARFGGTAGRDGDVARILARRLHNPL